MLTSSAAPSVSSIYDAQSDLRDVLFIAISQSGKSPDLLAATAHREAKAARSRSRCATRRTRRSCRWSTWRVPLHAGAETSVAATKSYIASLSAIAQLRRALDRGPALCCARCRNAGTAGARLGMRLEPVRRARCAAP